MMQARPDASYFARVDRWSSTEAYRREVGSLLAALDLHPGSRILDVGCGPGAAMEELRRRGVAPLGLDIYPAWADLCRQRPVVRADAARLPFTTGSMDAVLLVHVVAHFQQPDAGLREILRVLRPGGSLGLLTPNATYLRALRWRRGSHHHHVPDPTVNHHFNLRDLRRQVAAAGFQILHARPWGRRALPLPAASLRERLLLVATRVTV
ncbi:MAG: methyltransferase domain-containing protein [Acidobacteria bacterium]|nr:methyltransferase domain-containing protein [Acidobacteriota bacterium]